MPEHYPRPPHVFYGHGYRWMRRGPSRLLWFGIGAFFATMWARKHTEYRGACADRDRSERRLAWEERKRVDYPSQSPREAPVEEKQHQNYSTAPSSPSPPPFAPAPAVHPYEQWEDDKRKIVELTSHARDTIGDLSEQTLDSIMATVTDLKTKLAQHRADRQRDLDLAEKKARERHLV